MEHTISHMGRMGIDSRKLGVWFFLASEIMFFTGLIGAYIVLRFSHMNEWPQPGEILNIPLTGFNTFILICSSATLVLGLAAVQRGYQEGLQVGMFLTILLGSLFLAIQMKEYAMLIHEGLTISTGMYGACFYTLTGFHGVHVFAGVVWLIVVFVRSMQGKYTTEDSMGIECVGLYWHFVDLVWIILFTILYLI